MVLDCGARIALTTQARVESMRRRGELEGLGVPLTWHATDQANAASGGGWQPPVLEPGSVALLQYTSGSTSDPKGVMLTHAHFLDNVYALAARGQMSERDTIVSWLPLHHDMGLVSGMLLPMGVGAPSVLLAPGTFLQRPMAWLEAISRFRATVSGGPNFAYQLCILRTHDAQRTALDLSSWRLAFLGAERVRAETLDRFASAFACAGFRAAALSPCYGLAEATVGVSLHAPGAARPRVRELDAGGLGRDRVESPRPGGARVRLVGCGRPLGGSEVLVVDPTKRVRVAPNQIGELWVRAGSVASGYWGRPELSRASFHARLEEGGSPGAGYLRTGDLGFMDDGEVFVTGRLKDLIIVNGVNHYPEDIEATVQARLENARPATVAAFSVEVADQERLVVVCEAQRSQAIDASRIADSIRDAIAVTYELPVHRVVLVPPGAVPKTSSGKVQRSLARRLYLDDALEIMARSEPEPVRAQAPSEVVDRIRAIMAEVLGLEDVAATDDFFALGGHSLLATQLASRVRELLAVDLPLRAIFESPTPIALAAGVAAFPAAAPSNPIVQIDRSGRLPLSFSQERMWFLHRLNPQSAAYNVAGAIALDGPLDVMALEGAFDEVFDRHEVLRSTYPIVNGEPTVHIAPSLALHFERVDLSGSPESEARALELASALSAEPFDLEEGPLVRVALYRVAIDRHVLCVSMHHMVTDAWSMGVFARDVLAFYQLARSPESGPAVGRAYEPFGYVDYANWQRAEFSRERLRADLDYWRGALDGVTPLDLPTDRSRSGRRSSAGGYEPLDLPPDLLKSVKALGGKNGATPFMVLFAAFVALVHRYSGQTDIVVGVPVANRNRLASESLIGTLVNTLPLRVACRSEMSFDELLAHVRDVALEAYSHQDLPFERLVAELQAERRPGESPLVQVMFDYQNAPTPTQQAGALRIRPLVISRGASQFDLSVVVLDTEIGQMAGVEYAADLFDRATIRRFLGHFATVLQAVTADSTRSIARTPLLTQVEHEDLLARAQGHFDGPPVPGDIHSLVQHWAASTPDAPAVSDGAETLSYRALWRRACRLAARLVAGGAAPGRRVAVVVDRSCDLVVTLLATLVSGAAYVPIDPRYPKARIAFVLDDSAPDVIVTQSSLRSSLPSAAAGQIVCIDEIDIACEEIDRAPAPQSAGPWDVARPAYVLYTSGSTGRPKGVVISVGALGNFLQSMAHTPGIVAGDRLLSVTTISFDIAGLELWLPIVRGARVHVAPADVVADGRRLLELMERFSPTMMQATPATWRLLLEAGWRGDPGLKVLCGGEALARELAEQLLSRADSVWNMYGPTETTIWSTVHRVSSGDGPVPIGNPIDRTRVYILDPHGQLVPLGVPGEIAIGGAGVADGYFRRPDLTEQRFVADPFASEPKARIYRTGDLGRLRSDGLLEHLGRTDHQIKLRGFRIEPEEIEAVILQTGRAKDTVVVLQKGRGGDPRLVAYYVPAVSEVGTAELREAVGRVLPGYMMPSAFVALDALPRTPNGKLDRAALPELDATTVGAEPVAPRDPLEQELVAIWEDVLGTTRLGVRDDFFAVGGHSLLAVRLMARIERTYEITMPLATLLERPTVEALAAHIRELRLAPRPCEASPEALRGSFAHLVAIQSGCRPPLFCVHGAGGNVLNMRAIAQSIGPGRAFFALQGRGLNGRDMPFDRIEPMAAAYLRELAVVQPRGPYFLSGYCGGGLVAFEMARMLQERNEPVALLALIDTYRPGAIRTPALLHRVWAGLGTRGVRYVVSRAGVWAKREAGDLMGRARIQITQWRGRAVPHELRDDWLTQSFFRAAVEYRPGIYRGTLTVLRAVDAHPWLLGAGRDLGWGSFATGGVSVVDIPGNHDTIAVEPNLGALGAALRDCMVAAGAGDGTPGCALREGSTTATPPGAR
jgi:amino acid adenylation domain-containing protein